MILLGFVGLFFTMTSEILLRTGGPTKWLFVVLLTVRFNSLTLCVTLGIGGFGILATPTPAACVAAFCEQFWAKDLRLLLA